MTPGNNGASTPEDDDPFGYLYADGRDAGATPPSGGGGYGYPGSVNRVRAVGERQYGQQGQQAQTAQYAQAPYGQQQAPQQGSQGQPNAHYQAPETFPGGAPTTRQSLHGGGGGRRGPNTKGLLIGAISVVAVVVIGIGAAMIGSGDEDKGTDDAGSTPSAAQSVEPSETATKPADEEKADLPTIDAKALKLDGGATTASDVKGAQSAGGTYVAGLNTPGAQVTWTVNGIPKDGVYTLFAGYSAAGEDAEMTLTVNGKPFGSKLNLGNFAGAPQGDFEKGWTETYAWPSLNKGTNTISISCQDGDKCDVLLDQLSLKEGKVKN
ncbi:carbohydrate-binding protein [Streptomyces montanus]|uniref:Carbohydrate-binding protein n=1 Tax=Streptomyces montanus TaxID=2580423 RepID=A0A5R9FDM9_9ACTN|nr:carbohydrate-binding protein [Streptomyces montanus]TLS41251.1 carbohydrate-binding protein [Streptomyces montanus]